MLTILKTKTHVDNMYWKINIDTGGTFTDCWAIAPTGQKVKMKLLSNSSLRGMIRQQIDVHQIHITINWPNFSEGFLKGYHFRLLNSNEKGVLIEKFDSKNSTLYFSEKINFANTENMEFEITAYEEAPILAARLITQTPLAEQLPPMQMRLGFTKGTNALLERKGSPPTLFITKGFADLLEIGTQQRPNLFALNIQKPKQLYQNVIEVDERLCANGRVLQPLQLTNLEQTVESLLQQGQTNAAIVLMHSYKNPKHEQQLAKYLTDKGFKHISISSELANVIKILPRAQTTVVNAYLQPIIEQYLQNIQQKLHPISRLHIMTSAGGLVNASTFKSKDSLLSGPAAGIVGAATIAQQAKISNVISFDMGGTSTDVARFDGRFNYQFEQTVGDAHLFAPALAIETVAAGGGSICSFDGLKLTVGPESAGANPGPACYGQNGPLTITDVNLLLGRLETAHFDIPILPKKSLKELDFILQVNKNQENKQFFKEKMLSGFLKIANEKMAAAIKKISIREGYDPQKYALVAFGGAGGQHACELADLLEIKTILIPANAGILSAYGIGQAKMEQFAEQQLNQTLSECEAVLPELMKQLTVQATQKLIEQGVTPQHCEVKEQLIFIRFKGQHSTTLVSFNKVQSIKKSFKESYQKIYGHWQENGTIEVESLKVIVQEKKENSIICNKKLHPQSIQAAFYKQIFADGQWQKAAVFLEKDLVKGAHIKGVALILYAHSTLLLTATWQLQINEQGTAILTKNVSTKKRKEKIKEQPKAVALELFTNRFQNIVTEMGTLLQRTALSVNIKERLDFSCALLDAKGRLLVNAPHIPVHLGSLGVCVRSLQKHIEMGQGDVIITNHPAYGGSHLPDITLVSPVFTKDNQLIGYVANRAHHAEIGGSRPGSMPPSAKCLAEEGVVIEPTYIIRKGVPQWETIKSLLQTATYPTRSLKNNLADLNAGLAANHRGSVALINLVQDHSFQTVITYMRLLREHSAKAMIKTLSKFKNKKYNAIEVLDNKKKISVKISYTNNKVLIDFSETSKMDEGNLNATEAIVHSAVMYVLRLLIVEHLPLNEGILDMVELILPKGSLLNPVFSSDATQCPAVVGGNTEISQRLVDTLLKAFNIVACSQGTMNNLLFGNEKFGYYETIGGGSGAGATFDGADAIHTHMTNTRITDPEIMEVHYPVCLEKFAIRKGSGGKGHFKGGDGIIRIITFLEPMALSVLTQHRTNQPYGCNGGEAGKAGEQYIIRKNGARISLQSVDSFEVEIGDSLVMKTPGGGGFGKINT